MKKIYLKIILTVVVLILAYITVNAIMPDGVTDDAGEFELIIVDAANVIVYEDTLTYEKDQSFFDVLSKNFTLTCANIRYKEDPSCSYKFNIMSFENHVILGIKSDTFEIMTDWKNTFLLIEVYENEVYTRSSVGFDYIDLETNEKIRLRVDLVE